MKPLPRLLLLALLLGANLTASAQPQRFSFGVVASGSIEDAALPETLARADATNLAFVVALGIKPLQAGCEDAVFERRRNLFERSQHGLLPVPQASDWAACAALNGQTSAQGKLTRLRELLFQGEFSYGATKLPLVRQSTEARFHNFQENMRWEIGNVMFATINLPAPNNHFVMAAGRNGEFEDRLVANREWLRRVFTHARLQKAPVVVLFSDANPLLRPPRARRDGFAETRRYLRAQANRFKGKVLVVHAQAHRKDRPASINWRGNLGEIGVAHRWLPLQVDPGQPNLVTPIAPGGVGQ